MSKLPCNTVTSLSVGCLSLSMTSKSRRAFRCWMVQNRLDSDGHRLWLWRGVAALAGVDELMLLFGISVLFDEETQELNRTVPTTGLCLPLYRYIIHRSCYGQYYRSSPAFYLAPVYNHFNITSVFLSQKLI